MWHHFAGLPPVARVISALGVAAVAGWAFIKRKAIATLTVVLWNEAKRRFWTYVHRQIQTVARPSTPAPAQASPSNQKTYRGTFVGTFQHSNWPREHFFEIENGGTRTKVPIIQTNLLSGVQRGASVEIDTRTDVNYYAEAVVRVRIVEEPKAHAEFFKPDPASF